MDDIKQILEDFGKDRQGAIREALVKNKINASGKLSNSVSYQVVDSGFIFTLTISANGYFIQAVQEGKPPPKPSEEKVKLKDIREWVKVKPGLKNRSEQFAFATTQKINLRGTLKWEDFGSKGKTTGILEGIFSDEQLQRVSDLLAEKIEKNVVNSFVKFGNQ